MGVAGDEAVTTGVDPEEPGPARPDTDPRMRGHHPHRGPRRTRAPEGVKGEPGSGDRHHRRPGEATRRPHGGQRQRHQGQERRDRPVVDQPGQEDRDQHADEQASDGKPRPGRGPGRQYR